MPARTTPLRLSTTHAALLDACSPAARLLGTANWFSARVAAAIERQKRDPWTLTLAELGDLIDATPREPSSTEGSACQGDNPENHNADP
jgi:hypothetical protein